MTISATGPSGRNSVSARFHPPGDDAGPAADRRQRQHGAAGVSPPPHPGGHTESWRAFRRNWILSASAGSKPVSSSALSIHPERWQFMRLQPADDSARRRLTTGGATRSGCRCRPDASPRRKPSRGPGRRCAFPTARRGRRASSPTCLFFPAVKSRRFSCGLTPRWASTSTPRATASRWRRGSSHEA